MNASICSNSPCSGPWATVDVGMDLRKVLPYCLVRMRGSRMTIIPLSLRFLIKRPMP